MNPDLRLARVAVHNRLELILRKKFASVVQESLNDDSVPLDHIPVPREWFRADREPSRVLKNSLIEGYILRRGRRTFEHQPTGSPAEWQWPLVYPVRVIVAFRLHGNEPALVLGSRRLAVSEAAEFYAAILEGALLDCIETYAPEHDGAIQDIRLIGSDIGVAALGDTLTYQAVADVDVVTYTNVRKRTYEEISP
jgi:hypothetical protein